MPDFLSAHPDSYSKVSSGFVETLLQSRRAELFTGLMRLLYPEGDVFLHTFLGGVQQKLYRCSESGTESILRPAWMNILGRENASVFFMTMSVDSLRLMQMACEVPILRTDEHILTHQQLTDLVLDWTKRPEPAIVHILGEKRLDNLYLMSGATNPVIESVSFVDTASSFAINDAFFPSLLPSSDTYRVVRHVSDAEHPIWQGYELRLAFHPLMRLLINRFSELAGRMLTERLCERISSWLRDGGLDIKVTMNGIVNHHFFESLESSIDAYIGIIRCFHDEASPAIGLRMAEGLSRDILLKLEPYRRETLTRHIYNQDHLDTVTGRVWR